MEAGDIYWNLCVKDKRHPLWQDLYGYDEPEEIPEPRKGCSCDSCFYGKDKLAIEILRLQAVNKVETFEDIESTAHDIMDLSIQCARNAGKWTTGMLNQKLNLLDAKALEIWAAARKAQ